MECYLRKDQTNAKIFAGKQFSSDLYNVIFPSTGTLAAGEVDENKDNNGERVTIWAWTLGPEELRNKLDTSERKTVPGWSKLLQDDSK